VLHNLKKEDYMDIYKLLETDHNKVKKMLASIEKSKDFTLFEELKKEVIIHAEAEEEALYKPLESKAGILKVIIDTGHEEHDLVSTMMDELKKAKSDEEKMSIFAVIKKSLEAHILMEEEDIFALSKKCFSSAEAKEMAEDMKKSKEKYAKKLA
jgi:hemerythrin superfamily protein